MGRLKLSVAILGTAVLIVLLVHTTPGEVSADYPPELNWFAPSLALDSQGGPHISFWDKNVGNDLRYAFWDEYEGEWIVETVDDAAMVGKSSSLAIDANDHLHASYYDETNGDLKYAFWDGAQWSIEIVDATGDVGSDHTSLDLDDDGTPYISYCDATNGNLKYAYWDPYQGQWDIQVVDDDGSVGAYSSLQLDSAGAPHISYYDETNRDLKYAHGHWNGLAWVWDIQTVDEVGVVGRYTSLALDATDQPHISYYDETNSDLKYASWNPVSTTWDIEVVHSADDVGRFSSLALDADGNPRIGYHDSTNRWLCYARWDGSQWLIETVDDTVAVQGSVSLKLDADDQPHIAYAEMTNTDLRYAFWDPVQQQWVIQTAYSEAEAGVGYYNSLELDSTLGAHIAYYDKGERDLRYAHRYWNGSTWAWDIRVIDSEGRTGRYCSLELDANDYPRISYVDSMELEQSYAVWHGRQWTIEAVPNDEGMGRFSSMALDANDYPHFASYGQYVNGLAYARWDGTQWNSEVVDTVGNPGRSTSIAVDAAGHPHISYTDNENLKYAHWNGTRWITKMVASIGPKSGAHRMGTSIALDINGQPHIGYYDSTGGDLMHAYWDGTSWNTETVDDAQNVGARPSLRFDGDGHPHIGYYDQANGDLKYARWDGETWVIQTVDSEGDAGWWLSLALEPTAPYTPHLSYMERDNGVLKYTYWDGEQWVIEIVDEAGPVSADARFGAAFFSTKLNVTDLPCADLQEIGIHSTFFVAYWGQIEPQPDQYDWSSVDGLVDAALACGVEPMLKLTTAAGPGTDPVLPDDMKAYSRFVFDLAQHLKGRVRVYAIENEVDKAQLVWTAETYGPVRAAAYEAIKRADPDAQVLDSGMTIEAYLMARANELVQAGQTQEALAMLDRLYNGFRRKKPDLPDTEQELVEWLSRSNSQRSLALVDELYANPATYDAVQLHYLQDGWELIPEYVGWVRNWLAEAGTPDKPIEFWEIGFGWEGEDEGEEFTEEDHAQGVVKTLVVALGEGPSRVIYEPYWEEVQAGSVSSKTEDKFGRGLMTPDGPRLAATAYQTMASQLSGYQSAEPLNLGAGVWAYRFITPQGDVYVVWAEKSTTVHLPLTADEVPVTNIIGGTTTANPTALPVGANPIFIVTSAPPLHSIYLPLVMHH